MIRIARYWWPDDVGDAWKHSLRHVDSINPTIERTRKRRVALQAGGNVGLWPLRLASHFKKVITFEPDEQCYACLHMNCKDWSRVITSYRGVLADEVGLPVGLQHAGLGSHRVRAGDAHLTCTIDGLNLDQLDLLALDVEGYEYFVLQGAHRTLERTSPVIQLEMRNHGMRYGISDTMIRAYLNEMGYHKVADAQGSDEVFER